MKKIYSLASETQTRYFNNNNNSIYFLQSSRIDNCKNEYEPLIIPVKLNYRLLQKWHTARYILPNDIYYYDGWYIGVQSNIFFNDIIKFK